jgi:hypothetical protein
MKSVKNIINQLPHDKTHINCEALKPHTNLTQFKQPTAAVLPNTGLYYAMPDVK